MSLRKGEQRKRRGEKEGQLESTRRVGKTETRRGREEKRNSHELLEPLALEILVEGFVVRKPSRQRRSRKEKRFSAGGKGGSGREQDYSLHVSDELAAQDLILLVYASEDSVGDDPVFVGKDSFRGPARKREGRKGGERVSLGELTWV